NDGSDWDLYVLNACGDYIAHSTVRQTPISAQTEVIDIPAGHGKQTFTIRGIPYAPISTEYAATVTLTNAGSPPGSPDPDGSINSPCPATGGASGTITPSNR